MARAVTYIMIISKQHAMRSWSSNISARKVGDPRAQTTMCCEPWDTCPRTSLISGGNDLDRIIAAITTGSIEQVIKYDREHRRELFPRAETQSREDQRIRLKRSETIDSATVEPCQPRRRVLT